MYAMCRASEWTGKKKQNCRLEKHTEIKPGQNAVSFLYAHLSFACYECLTLLITSAYFRCAFGEIDFENAFDCAFDCVFDFVFECVFKCVFDCASKKDGAENWLLVHALAVRLQFDSLAENNYKLTIYQRRHQHTQPDLQRLNNQFGIAYKSSQSTEQKTHRRNSTVEKKAAPCSKIQLVSFRSEAR